MNLDEALLIINKDDNHRARPEPFYNELENLQALDSIENAVKIIRVEHSMKYP